MDLRYALIQSNKTYKHFQVLFSTLIAVKIFACNFGQSRVTRLNFKGATNMKANVTKKEHLPLSVIEIKSLEDHFYNMAKSGWLVNKISYFSCQYKKIEPQELQFFVDIIPFAYSSKYNNDVQEHRRIFEESGWKFVASSKRAQIFCIEKKADIQIPIYTNFKNEFQIALKSCIKYEFLPLPSALCAILLPALAVIPNTGYSLFLSNLGIIQALSLIIIVPPILWYLGFILAWYFKMSSYVKKDSSCIPKVNYKLALIRSNFLLLSTISYAALAALGFSMEIYYIGGNMVMIISPLIMFLVLLIVCVLLSNKTLSKAQHVSIVAISAILPMAFMTFVTLNSPSASTNERLPDNRMALTLADFGIEEHPNAYDYMQRSRSFVFPENYIYYETNGDYDVSTEVKKSFSPLLVHKLYQSDIEDLNRREWISLTEMDRNEVEIWGAIEGYYLNHEETEVLLLYEKAILRLRYKGEDFQPINAQEKAKSIANMAI